MYTMPDIRNHSKSQQKLTNFVYDDDDDTTPL